MIPKPIDSFKDRVQEVVRGIPKGKTLSYKDVASRAGNPGAARAVGMIMANNDDMSIPCHRVVRSDGKIGGYNGIRGGNKGSEAKISLLRAEGVLP
ncbi:MAG TPA: MGMT family protein [Candidatus Paceibacterota bacterium]|jgi:O-6-methylguanine DNA methyltransferase|nr:MGMT family protein [Candidatus Paceibacterota bacterium]